MKNNAVETILGAVVLIAACTFLVFALNTAQVSTIKGYQITAAFFKVGGLTSGSDPAIKVKDALRIGHWCADGAKHNIGNAIEEAKAAAFDCFCIVDTRAVVGHDAYNVIVDKCEEVGYNVYTHPSPRRYDNSER